MVNSLNHRTVCPDYRLGRHYDDRDFEGHFICGCDEDCYLHAKNAPTTPVDPTLIEDKLELVVRFYVSDKELQEELLSDLKHLITKQVIATEKAFGGCKKCYGKGYATTIDYTSGYGTDGDIGGFEGKLHHRNNIMKYCTCDRGNQLNTILEGSIKYE